MFIRLGRKRTAGAVAVAAVLATAGGAFAFFTGADGSGTASSAVGTSAPWNVTLGTPSFSNGLTAIYPGVGTETIPYTITNTGNGNQNLATLTATVVTDSLTGMAESAPGTDITGCLASWFVPVVDSPAPAKDLAPHATLTGNLTLTMTDSQTSQDACKSSSPLISLKASS